MLSEKARRILNDPNRIARRDIWFQRLSRLFDGAPDAFLNEHVMTVGGIVGRCSSFDKPYEDPKGCVLEYLENLALQLENETEEPNRFVPPCVEYPAYMVHFIDKLLGADVYYKDGQWNARYLDHEVGALMKPDLENNKTWMDARLAASTFVEQGVQLPLFGQPTLSSALNIAVNLYGQEVLLAMLIDPEAVEHDLSIIQDTIETTHKWYINHVPVKQLQPVISWSRTQPPGYGQLCGCTTQLISKETYDTFLRDRDNRLLGLYPHGGMIHLCGAHTQHLPTFASMSNLRAIQVNDRAALDLEEYFYGLREDQIIYVNPFAEMPVAKIMEITKGERVVICDSIDAPLKERVRH